MMFIGEAPGETEDQRGEPFVGLAGDLLNSLLHRSGIRRENVYITNILKCRPPGNRDPQADEIAACSPVLHQQIQAIQPKVLVTLGRHATATVSQTWGTMDALLQLDLHYAALGTPVVAIYHPAYLLRNLQASLLRDTILRLQRARAISIST